MGLLKAVAGTFLFSMVCCIIGIAGYRSAASIPGVLGVGLFILGILGLILSLFIPGSYVGSSQGRVGDVQFRADHYVEDGGKSRRDARWLSFMLIKYGVLLIVFGLISVAICDSF